MKTIKTRCNKVEYGNPFEKLISTLTNAGFTGKIVERTGAELQRKLETLTGRSAVFDYLYYNVMDKFEMILPDEEWVVLMSILDAIEPFCTRVRNWDKRMV